MSERLALCRLTRGVTRLLEHVATKKILPGEAEIALERAAVALEMAIGAGNLVAIRGRENAASKSRQAKRVGFV